MGVVTPKSRVGDPHWGQEPHWGEWETLLWGGDPPNHGWETPLVGNDPKSRVGDPIGGTNPIGVSGRPPCGVVTP